MTNLTTSHRCAYVVDVTTGETCADLDVDLYRSVLWVCDHHRFEMEYAAREVARRHFRWIEREYNESHYAEYMAGMRTHREKARKVYYMGNGEYIKIGVAESPRQRLDQIRRFGGVLAPAGLDLSETHLLAVEPGGYADEKARHREFAHLRVEGEWFRAAPELLAHVAAV